MARIHPNATLTPYFSEFPGVGPARAYGRRLAQGEVRRDVVAIDLRHVIVDGDPSAERAVAGLLLGEWQPGHPGGQAVGGCLAVERAR